MCDSPHCFFALKDTRQWPIGYDSNSMGQEVVLELPGYHKDCIEQLLNLRVPCLSIIQDLADKVHRLLFDLRHDFRSLNGDNCADNYVGGSNVQ
jgi:hypothetical protein